MSFKEEYDEFKNNYVVDLKNLINDLIFDTIDQETIETFEEFKNSNDVRDAVSFLLTDVMLLEACAIEEEILKIDQKTVEKINKEIIESLKNKQ